MNNIEYSIENNPVAADDKIVRDSIALGKPMHYVYIIECINGAYYTGYTTDIARRYKEHQQGSDKCRYTRSFPPKNLVLVLAFEKKSDALKKEAEIKGLTKADKVKLISVSNADSAII